MEKTISHGFVLVLINNKSDQKNLFGAKIFFSAIHQTKTNTAHDFGFNKHTNAIQKHTHTHSIAAMSERCLTFVKRSLNRTLTPNIYSISIQNSRQ